MADVKLVGFPQSTYVRTARLALEEKGVSYEIDPEVEFGSPALKEIHPYSKIPVLIHGDLVLPETNAICRYVDEAFDGPALQPADPRGRAEMEKWINYFNVYYDPTIVRVCVLERLVAPRFGRETDEQKITAAMPDAEYQLEVLERELGNRDYLAGDTVSLADFFMLPALYYFYITPEGGPLMTEEKAPNIGKWWERMSSRPSYETTKPPMPDAAE